MQRPTADEPEAAEGSVNPSTLGLAGFTDFLGRRDAFAEADLLPGSRLGDVTIVRLIAEGGMGRVYEGLQGMPCRTVAVKVVRPGVLSPAAMKRFEHEARILGRLTHPGIARIYSAGMQKLPGCEVPYFVMEFIEEARSICDFAEDRRLSIPDRVRLFHEACQAVAHGHQKGIVHRDLKPGNILVDGQGHAKVIDFGVARTTDSDVALTTMHTDLGQIVGTLQYMCPEQFDGESDDIDMRADVYALGIVLYQLLAGRMPYDLGRRAVYEVARIVREVEPTALSAVNPRLRGDLCTIVGKCLEKDRGRRYSSGSELEADIGRHLRGEPIVASPPRLLDAVVRLARRHRLEAAATAAVVASVLFGLIGISIFAVRADAAKKDALRHALAAEQGRDEAEREKIRADTEAETSRQRLYVANMRSLRSCIDARNLRAARQLFKDNAAIAKEPLPLELLCLRAELDDSLVVLASAPGPVNGVKYSPDGRLLAAVAVAVAVGKQSLQKPLQSAFLKHPQSSRGITRPVRQLFSVGGRHRYERLGESDVDWQRVWNSDLALPDAGHAPPDSLPRLARSPDGLREAVQASDGRVRIVERSTGREVAVLDGPRGRLRGIEFSPDGGRLAVLGGNETLGLWDAADGRRITPDETLEGAAVSHAFSPDGSRFATVFYVTNPARDRRWYELTAYDAASGRRLFMDVMTPEPGSRNALMAFSADNALLVTSFSDRNLRVRRVADGADIAALRGHAAVVTALGFSPDGSQFASGDANGHLRLWHTRAWRAEGERMGHDGEIRAVAFCPDGKTIASGSQDGTVRIWSRQRSEPLAVLDGLLGITAAAYSPSGKQLAVAPQGGGDVEIWDSVTVERLRTLAGSEDPIKRLVYSPDGGFLAAAFESAGTESCVRAWNADTGEQLFTAARHPGRAGAVAFSPDGTRLLVSTLDGSATVWDMRTRSQLWELAAGDQPRMLEPNALFCLDGTCIAHGSDRLLDAATGRSMHSLRPRGMVSCLATSPDGRVLATGGAMGTVSLEAIATGTFITMLAGHSGGIRAIDFDPAAGRVVTGSLDGTARIWNAVSGEPRHVLRGHEGAVDAAFFTPDGRRIVTTGRDGSTRIWDADGGQELWVIPGQKDQTPPVAIHPEGTQLVAAGSDGRVRIWGLSNAAITAARCSSEPLQQVSAAP